MMVSPTIAIYEEVRREGAASRAELQKPQPFDRHLNLKEWAVKTQEFRCWDRGVRSCGLEDVAVGQGVLGSRS